MKKFKITKVIIILSVVTFLCLIGYSANREKASFVKSDGFHKISNTFQFITNILKVKKENEELKKTNDERQTKALEDDELIKQNERMKSMLKFSKKRVEYNYIGANIIGNKNGLTIDIGEDEGIKKGMIAMTGQGLVGQVISVGNNWSILKCLYNETFSVAALVQGTKDNNGIITGYKDKNNKLFLKMDKLSLESGIKKGDVIVTSGLGRIYPSGINIGKVLTVHDDKSNLVKNVIVEPYIDFSKLEEVFIVESKDPSGIEY